MRIGYDRIAGYLKGGTEAWYTFGFPVERLPLLSVHELKEKLDRGDDILVLDVRGKEEWEHSHVPGSMNIYVGHLEERTHEIPRDRLVAVMCTVGHMAGMGASILLRAGFTNVYNVLGSHRAWVSAGLPVASAVEERYG